MVPPRLPRCATCGLDSERRGRGSGEPVHADHGPDLQDALLTRSSIRSRPQSLLAKPYLLAEVRWRRGPVVCAGQRPDREALSYKPYPCGRPLHAAIDAALAARAQLEIERPDQIESVTIEADPPVTKTNLAAGRQSAARPGSWRPSLPNPFWSPLP